MAQPPVYFPSPKRRSQQFWQRTTGQYPFVQQQSAVDCGVACMVMIGRFWGKRLSLNALREVAQVDQSGATLKGLVRAADTVGFAARPVKASLDQLAKQALPAIVHWEGKHYVVVYEIKPKGVVIADPAVGCRKISLSEFQEKWTGYTLLLQPTAMLQKVPNAKEGWGRFVGLLYPHRRVLVEIVMASVFVQLLGLVTPLLTQLLLDRVVVQRSDQALYAFGSGLVIFSLFRVMMRSLQRYLLYHTANRLDLSLVVGFIGHALRLKLGYFETRYVGDITSRIEENQKIRAFLTGGALTTLLDVMTVFVYIGLMCWYSWKMAAIALTLIPLLGLITLVMTPFLQQVSRESFNARTLEGSYLIEVLTGITTIKSMGLERLVRWRWEKMFTDYIKLNFSAQVLRERLQFASGLVEMLVAQVLLLFGIWQVIHDQLTVGQLLAFNMLVGNVIDPFVRLIDLWDDFQEIVISLERLNDVLGSPPEQDLALGSRLVMPPIKGLVEFDQVTFRYGAEGKPVLDRISFTVQPGQTLAIVGRSGSGKTTLSKLLLGLYLPTDGRVLIDGHDIAKVDLHSLRTQVGVVDQNTFLFGGSIQDNLLIGHQNADPDSVREAARLAGADLFIDELPMGYNTQIGEGGGMLSGGQRQRLAIARALMGDPRLLILDEATSSLDTESERIIQQNLQAILSRQTTFVIAHRLSTIRRADVILVLDRGQIVEQGDHAELMAQQGAYYNLTQQQIPE
jgi:HlyB family type I secretion system ABC transporter